MLYSIVVGLETLLNITNLLLLFFAEPIEDHIRCFSEFYRNCNTQKPPNLIHFSVTLINSFIASLLASLPAGTTVPRLSSLSLIVCKGEMVRQARILAQATSDLVNAIKADAEGETDLENSRKLLSAAKLLADATAKMVEAAKVRDLR